MKSLKVRQATRMSTSVVAMEAEEAPTSEEAAEEVDMEAAQEEAMVVVWATEAATLVEIALRPEETKTLLFSLETCHILLNKMMFKLYFHQKDYKLEE